MTSNKYLHLSFDTRKVSHAPFLSFKTYYLKAIYVTVYRIEKILFLLPDGNRSQYPVPAKLVSNYEARNVRYITTVNISALVSFYRMPMTL